MTISYDEALKGADSKRSLLIGNGFSIAQAGGQFSYSTLLEKSGLQPDSSIRNLFDTLGTVDFELVMRALQDAAKVEDAYGAADRATLFGNDAAAVREALIHAVRQVHPGISFDIPQEQRNQCGSFLKNFANVFTVNYDLLLYWVILRVRLIMYPGGSCSGESAREQLDAGDHEPCFGARNRCLEVLCKTTIAVEPGDGSFDDPAAWQ
jgi:hypothetical protein